MIDLIWDIIGVLIGAFFIYKTATGIIQKKIDTRAGLIDAKKNKISYIMALIIYGLLGVIILAFVFISIL